MDISRSWIPIGNPVDIWPAVMNHNVQKMYRIALKGVPHDPFVDGVVCIALVLRPSEQDHLTAVEVIQEPTHKADKPIGVWCCGLCTQETAALQEEQA